MSKEEDGESIAQNPGTPPEKLRSLLKRTLEEEQKNLEEAQKKLIGIGRYGYRLTHGSSPNILKHIAKNTNTPSDAFESLARFNPPYTWRHPVDDTDFENWSKADQEVAPIAWEQFKNVHYNNISAIHHVVASNPSTPAEVLSLLSKDSNPDVRVAVAKNSNTPPDVLAVLKTDEVEWVRRAMSQEEYLQERRIAHRKKKNLENFWKRFPWSGGIFGAICGLVGCTISKGSDGGGFLGIVIGVILGGLWAWWLSDADDD